jgi:uncharacterized Zn-finger protein
MTIEIRCTNEECPEFDGPRVFPEVLRLAEGESVLCGDCGQPVEFSTPPVRDLPWAAGMQGEEPKE